MSSRVPFASGLVYRSQACIRQYNKHKYKCKTSTSTYPMTTRGEYSKLDPDVGSDSESENNFHDTVDSAPMLAADKTCIVSESDNESLSESHNDPIVEGSSSHLPSQSREAPTASSHAQSPGRIDSSHSLPGGSSDLEGQSDSVGLSARQRALNVLHFMFPVRQTYERLSNGLATGRMQVNTPGRFVGQGTDGVFRNLMAKPDTEATRVGQEQHPPSYEEAAADATPEYWETTMISPMYEDEVFVQGLPVGNLANFVWNTLVTVAFQLVGFILCYLLHTSHAAKHGTRAGLGISLIMFGYNIVPANSGRSDRIPPKYEPNNPNLFDISKSLSIKTGGQLDTYQLTFKQGLNIGAMYTSGKGPYFAYGMIAFGLFVVIKALVDFYRIKQTELQILAPQAQPETHTTTEEMESPVGQ